MIKNDSIKQIQQVAMANTEKVYEIVDRVVGVVVENFEDCQVQYDESQNRFIATITDKQIGISISPLIDSTQVGVVVGDNASTILRLGIHGEYNETRTRMTKEENNLISDLIYDIGQIDITKEDDVISEPENVASDGTVVEEITEE